MSTDSWLPNLGFGEALSSSLHIYVGPYISCFIRPRQTEIEVLACSKCSRHPENDGSKFCSACGSKIVSIKRLVDDPVDHADVVGEDVFIDLHSDGHRDGPLFLGSNLTVGPWGRNLSYGSREVDEEHVDMTALDREAEMRSFGDHYADAIAKLRESFDDVRIRWGMHLFCF